ncbi:MAG: hypothetical protein ACJ8AG_18120 [Ktedonobacteraceae bacterium]
MSSRRYTNGLGFRVIFAMPGRDGSSQLIHLRRSRYQDLLLFEPGDFVRQAYRQV